MYISADPDVVVMLSGTREFLGFQVFTSARCMVVIFRNVASDHGRLSSILGQSIEDL
jgi:hypothetical protein